MTPRTLVPSPKSIPFDDLKQGHGYQITIRPPQSHALSTSHYHLTVQFVELVSAGRGEELAIVVLFPGGDWIRIGRSQIVMIEEC